MCRRWAARHCPVVAGHSKAARQRTTALSRVIAMVNDKGGVGKTSLVANLAGQLVAFGYRCLLLHLNRQANPADDLGYRDDERDDQGASLLISAIVGTALEPVTDVRPGLDVVPGGPCLAVLVPLAQPAWWTSLREATGTSGRLSIAAAGGAGDYRDVAAELLTLVRTVEEPVADETRAEAMR